MTNVSLFRVLSSILIVTTSAAFAEAGSSFAVNASSPSPNPLRAAGERSASDDDRERRRGSAGALHGNGSTAAEAAPSVIIVVSPLSPLPKDWMARWSGVLVIAAR